ncbi:unnamed protein product, partial [marine sediment metagenome]
CDLRAGRKDFSTEKNSEVPNPWPKYVRQQPVTAMLRNKSSTISRELNDV